MRFYIAGGIADYANLNKTAFMQAELALENAGFDTLNPWRNGLNGKPGIKGHVHMRADFLMILNGYTDEQNKTRRPNAPLVTGPADGIVVLPGGELSLGVQAEISFARSLHLAVLPYQHVIENAHDVLERFVLNRRNDK